MKVVDIERVVILMRFIQYGWDEERKRRFDDDLRMMLETQCEDLEEHDKQIRAEVIKEHFEKIMSFINTSNRGNCDYFIVDQIENYIAEQLKEQNK